MRRTNLLRYLSATLFSVSLVAIAASSCSVITDSDIAAGGIGIACSSDNDCQGGSCDHGACIVACSADGDCPTPSQCMGGRCAVETVVGQSCDSFADCQGAKCESNICTTNCETASDCPDNYLCLNTTCQKPLKVAGVWIGIIASAEGWTLTHHEGIQDAQERLGYIDYTYGLELLGPDAEAAVDQFVADGAEVIIANSWDYIDLVQKKHEEYPDVKFLHCSGFPIEPNVAAYFAHMEQAWFVAGRIAAQKTVTNHLGFIGSFNNGEVVRHINSFTLGARHQFTEMERNPDDIKVEVRWTGFWYDPAFDSPQYEYTPLHMGTGAKLQRLTAEEYLTAKLIDSGADVITHNLDNQLTSRYVGKHTTAGTLKDPKEPTQDFDVWTIANDNRLGWQDQNGAPYVHAIGTTYWNWGPMYTQIFEDIHQGKFVAKDYLDGQMGRLSADASSIVSFGLSTAETDVSTTVLESFLSDTAKAGHEAIFTGPVSTNGQQRDGGNIPSGVAIDESEWRNMCWFVKGIVERENPNDPTSDLVDALVPGSDHPGQPGDKAEPPEGTPRQPTTAPEMFIDFGSGGAMWNCRLNQGLE